VLLNCDKIAGLNFNINRICEEIKNVISEGFVRTVQQNRQHILWNWIPSAVYNVLGHDKYKEFHPVCFYSETFLLINHLFLNQVSKILDDVSKIANVNEIFDVNVSRQFLAGIYGGFPWFESVFSIYSDLDLFEKTSKCILLTSNTTDIDIVTTILDFKFQNRDNYGKTIYREYPHLRFRGEIHTFHCPQHIEVEQHLFQVKSNRIK